MCYNAFVVVLQGMALSAEQFKDGLQISISGLETKIAQHQETISKCLITFHSHGVKGHDDETLRELRMHDDMALAQAARDFKAAEVSQAKAKELLARKQKVLEAVDRMLANKDLYFKKGVSGFHLDKARHAALSTKHGNRTDKERADCELLGIKPERASAMSASAGAGSSAAEGEEETAADAGKSQSGQKRKRAT